MLNVILAFVFGAAIMDFMWAYKLGMPQAIWRRMKSRLIRK